jgi:hypothetical protein
MFCDGSRDGSSVKRPAGWLNWTPPRASRCRLGTLAYQAIPSQRGTWVGLAVDGRCCNQSQFLALARWVARLTERPPAPLGQHPSRLLLSADRPVHTVRPGPYPQRRLRNALLPH